ncbi:hypothetical protein BKA62DRAFT_802627, partial [Auriculariales sp. MPI-PUGE-AT-0066]
MSKYEESPNGPLVALHYSDDVQLPAINQTLRGPDREKATNKPSVVVPYTFVDLCIEGILHQDTLRRGFPSHMIWRPPQAWEHQYPEVYNHLQTMTIPTIPLSEQSEPDLLLYALGSFLTVDSTISKKTGDSHASIYVGIFSNSPVMVLNRPHRLLADTSGAGKTRFISEYLARNGWGFYFTFEVDRTSSPYGSADLSYAIVHTRDQRFRLPDQEPFVPVVDPSDVTDGDSVEQKRRRWELRWQNNEAIAEHAFTNLLLARLLVYDAFCKAVLQRAWCLLQIVPHLSGDGDIFLHMFRAVKLVKQTVAADLIKTLRTRLRNEGFCELKILA